MCVGVKWEPPAVRGISLASNVPTFPDPTDVLLMLDGVLLCAKGFLDGVRGFVLFELLLGLS